MLNLKFHCSFLLSLYLAATQYLALLILVPIIIGIQVVDKSFVSLPMIPLLILCLIFFVAIEDISLGLITVRENGFSGYTFRQFGKSSEYLDWDDIYRVEPYRYFGLPFFLVRYHKSDLPLWFPLFLIEQNKLNFVILERTAKNNPLRIAILEKNYLLKQVPWHSKLKKHKSDRCFLESCYTNIFYFSLEKYFFFAAFILSILLIFTVLAHQTLIDKQYILIDLTLVIISSFICFGGIWYFLFKDFYIEVKNTGIGFATKSLHKYYKWFFPWSEIAKIEYNRFLIFSEIQIFTKDDRDGYFNFSKILLCLIDRNKFKATIINNLPANNLLYQVVVKNL